MKKRLISILLIAICLIIPSVSALTVLTTCPGSITVPDIYEVNKSLNTTAGGEPCFTLDTDNVTIDCRGFSILYNDGEGNKAITATGRRNLTIKSCIIQDTFSGPGTRDAIFFSGTNNSFITNNTIIAGGSTNTRNTGILFQGSSTNNTVQDNNITVNGNIANNHGLTLISSFGNRFISNSISVNSTSNFAINLSDSSNNSFLSTLLSNPVGWIRSNVSSNNFTNITFETPNGSIRFLGLFQVNGTHDITRNNLNISLNNSFLNSTNLTFMNISAQVTLNVDFLDPGPVVDFEDDGTFATCEATQCQEVSFTGGAFVFNVSSFTSYQATENAITCNSAVNQSAALVQNISSTTTNCLNITEDNVVLDCAGFTITYDGDGENNNLAGVQAIGRNNVTINNCTIVDTFTGGVNNRAIWFTDTNNSRIINTTLRAGGLGHIGLYLNHSFNNIIDSVNVSAAGGASSALAIENSSGNQFTTINFSAEGAGSRGINITGTSNNTFIDVLLTNPTEWIFADNGTNNFTTTTFATPNGSINFSFFQLNGSQDITTNKLNITSNAAFVNSTNLTFLNTSARITLHNITFANPRPLVDFEDDGTFEVCSAAQCTEISFSGEIFTFDVVSFTSYGSGATPASSSGGSSSGGGGGSASRYYAQGRLGVLRTQTLPVTDSIGLTKLLSPGIEYTYTLQNTPASIAIAALEKGMATFTINPGDQNISLETFQVFKQDVNGDGIYDLSIQLLGVTPAAVTVKFTPIQENIPAPIPESTEEVEKEEQIPTKVAQGEIPPEAAEPLQERAPLQSTTVSTTNLTPSIIALLVIAAAVIFFYRKKLLKFLN